MVAKTSAFPKNPPCPRRRMFPALGTLFLLAGLLPLSSHGYNQPPMNLGATTFLDGGGAPPGLLWMEYVQFANGAKGVDQDGKAIPGGAKVNALVNLSQFFYLSPLKALGGNVGFDVLVPVSAVTVKGSLGPVPVTANTGGVGDITLGAALQWNRSKLLGAPLFQRAEVYSSFPTGRYDKSRVVNPGANKRFLESYYAFTWMFRPKWETSWRILYGIHEENPDTRVKPGQVFHFNYAFSREVGAKFRLGAAGYFLQQTTEDRINGTKAVHSKERALSVGPGVVYMGPGFMAMVSHPVDLSVRNRFQGSLTTFQLIHRF
ncbi:MAG: transporter [Elusimicrobia bacterium]|nr:transporter [Elusimicrobiota bacterium]